MSAEVRASIIDGGTVSLVKENTVKLVVRKLMKLIIAFGWRKFVVKMNYGKEKTLPSTSRNPRALTIGYVLI